VDSPIEGTITSISVREGDVVQEGDGLVTVTDLTAIGSRGSAAQVVSEGIEARRSLLIDEMAIAGRNAEQAEVERRSRIGALQSSRVATQDQIVRQQKLLANARENLNVAREVAKNGFLSRQDLSKREEGVLAREQVLSQLRQEIVDTDAKIAVERAGLRRDVATYETRLAALRASRESLGQESAQTERISRVKLIAPISGRIGAAWLSKGQRVAAGALSKVNRSNCE
jgi:membrane fusion protein